MERRRWVVPAGVNERVDRALARAWPEFSRNRIGAWFDDGRVQVDGKPARASLRVTYGQEVDVAIPPPEPTAILPEKLDVPLLYEDADLVVLVKPAGMVVHPSPGHRTGTLVNALLAQVTGLSGIGGEERPGIVHRLDVGTSGVMVAAKNDLAHRALSAALAAHTLERRYLAVVHKIPLYDSGTFRSHLARDPANRLRMASVPEVREEEDEMYVARWGEEDEDEFPELPSPPPRTGRLAITHWKLLGRADRLALVTARLETGRTHQVRAHFSEAGHPIVGDSLYGRRDCVAPAGMRDAIAGLTHPLLHAFRLAFAHPRTGEWLSFDTPPPADFVAIAASAGLDLPELASIKG